MLIYNISFDIVQNNQSYRLIIFIFHPIFNNYLNIIYITLWAQENVLLTVMTAVTM